MAINEVLKYEGQFKSYLTKITDNQRVVTNCISRCRSKNTKGISMCILSMMEENHLLKNELHHEGSISRN
jgi:hypothetical protein